MPRHRYPSDLTDVQWMHLEPHLPGALPGGRRGSNRRMPRTLAWRALPHDSPPWQTVYHYFRVWRMDGTWERLNHELREAVRERAGRKRHPSAGILDSQSAKTTEKGGRVVTTGPRS